MRRCKKKEQRTDVFQFTDSSELIRRIQAIDHALGAKEVAQLLAVNPKTVYKWAAQGVLPCIRAEGAVRFDPGVIAEWIQGRMFPRRADKPHSRRIA